MKENKITLHVQPKYSIIIHYILGLIFLSFMFVPMLLSWEKGNRTIEILYYLVLALFVAYGFVMGTLHIQFAKIDKESITIKDLFHTIAIIKWEKISSAKKEKILTYNSRGYICLEWIVIRTDERQKVNRAKYNRKGKFPLLIIANKKNLSILSKYIKVE